MTDSPARLSVDGAKAELAAQRLFRRVLRQWWLIALCAVVAGSAAFVASSSRTKVYEASSTIEVGTVDLVSIYLSDQVQVREADPDRLKAGAIETFTLPNVRDRAAGFLKLPTPATPDRPAQPATPATSLELRDAVRVESKPDSSVLTIIARDPSPLRAKNMSNAMVEAFIAQRRETIRNKILDAKTRITRQLANLPAAERNSVSAQALRQRLRDVGVIGATADGNVTKIQGARVPTAAVAPRPKRDAALGLIAGLLLGLAIALLRARLDDRIRDTEELTELWELPVVGIVPHASSLKEAGPRLPDPAALEALSLARTNLRYLHVGGSLNAIAVTSALESEGKSTVVWNLAIATSLAGSRVLVVEADLRRPRITSRLSLSGNGLSEILAGIATADDAIHTIDVAGADDASVATQVDVIPAGLVPPSPLALLEGDNAKQLFAELRERYDVVLVDTPPSTVVADAVALSDAVDAIVVVSRLGTVRRGAYKRLREILTGIETPVIGQIVNGDRSAGSYGYYSSYAPKKAAKANSGAER